MAADLSPNYAVTGMHPEYVGEDEPGNDVWAGSQVPYLSEVERAAHLLSIEGGLIYDALGNLFDTTGAESLFSDEGRAIYVMDQHGNFYASKFHQVGKFHHSSLIAGGPVAAAGEIEVKNGKLVAISDKSGHYRPKRSFTNQALHELKKRGMGLSDVKRDFVAPYLGFLDWWF